MNINLHWISILNCSNYVLFHTCILVRRISLSVCPIVSQKILFSKLLIIISMLLTDSDARTDFPDPAIPCNTTNWPGLISFRHCLNWEICVTFDFKNGSLCMKCNEFFKSLPWVGGELNELEEMECHLLSMIPVKLLQDNQLNHTSFLPSPILDSNHREYLYCWTFLTIQKASHNPF